MTTAESKVFKGEGKQRTGRGFSREELKKAGIDHEKALRLKIPIDMRRKTTHEENVETIKTFLQTVKTRTKPAKKKKRGKSKS